MSSQSLLPYHAATGETDSDFRIMNLVILPEPLIYYRCRFEYGMNRPTDRILEVVFPGKMKRVVFLARQGINTEHQQILP